MLTADHPNAIWLKSVYDVTVEIGNDQEESWEGKARRFQELLAKSKGRMSPDLIVHTGGLRFRATMQGADVGKYSKRRNAIIELFPTEIFQIIADDRNGIIYGNFRLTRIPREGDSLVWQRFGLGLWRFKDGIAVEHWETPDAHEWDAFLQPIDPTFEGTGAEFWTKEG